MAMPMVCRGLIAAAIAAALGLTAAPAHAADPPSPDQSPDVSVTIGELPSDGSICPAAT
jgi:hypothetical protein